MKPKLSAWLHTSRKYVVFPRIFPSKQHKHSACIHTIVSLHRTNITPTHRNRYKRTRSSRPSRQDPRCGGGAQSRISGATMHSLFTGICASLCPCLSVSLCLCVCVLRCSLYSRSCPSAGLSDYTG